MNKINTKSKGKDDKSKGNKSTNEDNEDHDFSLLRKPVLTSITGFAQARKIFDFATEELKSLLANECDLLYECKVCRNIFRSLANLISHKRVYCKEKFSSSVHSHFVKNTSAASEMLKIKRMEQAYQESLKATATKINEDEDRIPISKDLTGIVEKLSKLKGRYNFDEQLVTLQKIPNSSVAVFQSNSDEKKLDNMQAQVQELDSILSQDKAVLQRDGSFNVQSKHLNEADKNEESDNVIQISDDDDSDDGRVPKCKICDMQFSTQKTLKFHMKYKHLESRLVYPCPDCFEIFSTSWSVYRHLFKVHRKSAAQIRRLRDAIQTKAFRMNNPPAIYEKKKNMKSSTAPQKISEEERLDQENQAWMDNMEGDGELPRCGGCGRTFERRAALAAHTHTCQPRSRALARRPDRRIEIQIRRDYHKGPPLSLLPKPDENKVTSAETQTAAKAIAEKQSEPVEKAPEPIEKNSESTEKNPAEKKSKSVEKKAVETVEKQTESNEMELVEATMDIIDDKSNDSMESPEKYMQAKPVQKNPKFRLPFAHQAEKSNLAAFKQRMQGDIDLEKLLCKKCDAKHARSQDLFDHMAAHYKWIRYACKLCNFKNYDFEKLPEHVKVVHKLKGDSDFYFSTVKAVDGTEALELAEPEENEANEESSESRRPSRCSSDSSRLSDDSSSSSTRLETGARKRKMYQNRSANKRRKEAGNDEVNDVKESDVSMDRTNNVGDGESSPNAKTFEENSSDMEEPEDKYSKRHIVEVPSTVASRRPVRKKTKPKNADFEYDLSNLLKMEAQGYRDSQVVITPKVPQNKKKIQQELQSNYDIINKDHIGAMAQLSKIAVDKAAAELKSTNFSAPALISQKEQRASNIFARPMLPKVPRSDKISPRKDSAEDINKDGPTLGKVPKIQDTVSLKDTKSEKVVSEASANNPTKEKDTKSEKVVSEDSANNPTKEKDDNNSSTSNMDMDDHSLHQELAETLKAKLNIPAVVPIKFRRQSLELMNNPIINKNITDFSKAGMKTKILLIKPINRNKDGVPMKFQTIKLKDPNKGLATNEDKSNDQIVVVKVPKVDRTGIRNPPDSNSNNKRPLPPKRIEIPANVVENKNLPQRIICPTTTSSNTTENSTQYDENNKMISSKTKVEEQNFVTNINKDMVEKTKIKEPVLNNVVGIIDCGNKISDNLSVAPSNASAPMDMEESNKALEIANGSMKSSLIRDETTDCEPQPCSLDSPIILNSFTLNVEDKTTESADSKENVSVDKEPQEQLKINASPQELADSVGLKEIKITNGDVTPS